jgi:peptidoglycan/xylan/chitin deacetylase (PgdA/CDA1 family)
MAQPPAVPAVPHLRPIPILTYHQIAPAPPKGAAFRSLYVAPSAFARQMAWLRLLGYQGLAMGQLMPYLLGEKAGKVVGVTFDDGYLNNLTHALPILAHHGFSSTCYVVSQMLGQTNRWDCDAGVAQTPLMSPAQVRQWVAGGQELGAHTRHHAHLTQLSTATAREEIELSKVELQTLVGVPVQHFCYPFGEFALEHVGMVRDAGYVSATTTQRGRSRVQGDMLQLSRVPVVRSTTLAVLWLKLATAYEDWRRP